MSKTRCNNSAIRSTNDIKWMSDATDAKASGCGGTWVGSGRSADNTVDADTGGMQCGCGTWGRYKCDPSYMGSGPCRRRTAGINVVYRLSWELPEVGR